MNSRTKQDEGVKHSLSDQLRSATRRKHQGLNTQIIARLPLCLPANAASPLNYAKGIVVFGQIYLAFERFLTNPALDIRLSEIHRTICLPQLLRTSRLHHDIALLKSRLARNEIEELESLAEESRVFSHRIESSLAARPHTLLAYTYTMYLALFNGGQWIRKQLVAAGSDFWLGKKLPLSFWEFDDPQHPKGDDEQLKDAFKNKFLEVASQLAEDEQQEVVDEAVRLFDLCSELVDFLDEKTTAMSCPPQPCPVVPSGVSSAEKKAYMIPGAAAATVQISITSAWALFMKTASTAWRDRLASSS